MLTVVSGLTSSGKALMIEALRAGGVKILNGKIFGIDKGDTHDILEYEKIEQLTNHNLWFEEGEDWAVSLASVLLKKLPLNHNYNIIFIERNIDDIIRSNENIFSNIITSNENLIQDDLKKAFIEAHAGRVKKWLHQTPNFNIALVDYDALIEKPTETINEINEILKLNLDVEERLSAVENIKF